MAETSKRKTKFGSFSSYVCILMYNGIVFYKIESIFLALLATPYRQLLACFLVVKIRIRGWATAINN